MLLINRKLFLPLILVFLILISCTRKPVQLQTETFTLDINQKGLLVKLCDTNNNNYLVPDLSSPICQISIDGNYFKPTRLTLRDGYLSINFEEQNTRLKIACTEKHNYITFELVELNSPEKIQKIVWGPYNVTLADKVGKSIGLAYNNDFAIGLIGLNLKSCGGFELIPRERFGNAAQKTEHGAVLQGFTKNRSEQVLENSCLQELTQAAPVNDSDSTLIGSKFAIYGVPTENLKTLIPEIEQHEGLPYLTHNNEWLKNTLYATSSKFIMSFNSHNIDACLDVAEKAGITCIYHPGIFESWGTYPVREKDFPNGYQSVLECTQKAKARNMTLGAHTLSNLLTKDDPLVSPVPHPNLQLAGVTSLKKAISEDDIEIILADLQMAPAYTKDKLDISPEELNANENKNRETFAVKIGNEIIEYSTVTKNGELLISGCKRGAFGTQKSSHNAGAKVGRLVSHYYKVFFPDINLQDEVAKNLAHFFNQTKLERISFDGIEGAMATGHGRYSCDRFIKVFFDHLENKNIIANSSDVMHYSWHYFANESWGEPWWAKNFRESQLDHRLKVQKELEEDLMPRKMGQFRIDDKTTFKDIQWVMGLCVGYDAGVDFYISPQSIKQNREGEEILNEIKRWEKVRWDQTLTEEQKEQLRDPFSFYQLNDSGSKPELVFVESWAPETGKIQGDNDRNTLPETILKRDSETVISLDYEHINMQKEPGQPTFAEWEFYNAGKKQKLQFSIRLPKESKENASGIYLKIDADVCAIPFTLKPGEYVTAEANEQAAHYSADGKLLASEPIPELFIEKGKNSILFDYKGKGREAGPKMLVNFKVQK
ncbi:hypothetical protein INQ51_16015 [Maribellus sp. CM-23]|uniref:hypothetical protein n=1 Tax=Maribellus sp. CM-23 TaxID=2781026 RepID=UPI001F30ADF5|nr:hypothetical protein [Maribellus sp. CM-23]MCE4565825.1 hypothetical protein [Maribellus sp. CM-23]